MKIQAGLLSLLAITAGAQSTTSYPGSCIGRCGLRGTEQGVNTGNAGPVPGVPPPFGPYPGAGGAYPGYGYPGYGYPGYGPTPIYGRQYYSSYGYGGYYGGYGYGGYGYGGYGYGGYGYGGYGYGGYGYGGYGYGGYGYGAGYPAPGYRPPPVQSCSCDQGCFSRGTCCEDVNGRGGVTTECQLASRYPTVSPTTAPPTTAPPTTAPPTTPPPTTAPPTTPSPTASTASPTLPPTNPGDTRNPTRAPTSTPTSSPTNPPTNAPTETVKLGTGATTLPDATDTCTRAPTCQPATIPVTSPPTTACVFWDPVVGAFDSAIKAASCDHSAPLQRITLGWEKNLGRISLLQMATEVNALTAQFADATNKQLIATAYNTAVYPSSGSGRRLLQAIQDPNSITTIVSYREVTPAPTASPTILPTPTTSAPTLAPPVITDITFRPAAGLGQGQTFDIVVTYDKPVIVSDASSSVYPSVPFTYTTSSATSTNTAAYDPTCKFNDLNNGEICFSHTSTSTLSSATDVYIGTGQISLPANGYISSNNNGARGAEANLTVTGTTMAPNANVNNKYVLVQAASVESFAMTRPTVGSTKFQVNVTFSAEVFISTQSTYPTIRTEIKAPSGTSVAAVDYAPASTTQANDADVYYVSQTVTNGKSTLVFERDLIASSTFGGAWVEGMTFNVLGSGTGTGVLGRDIMGAIKTQTPTYTAGSTPYIQNANAQGTGTSSGLDASLGLTASTGTITVSGLGINTGITVYKTGTTQTTAIQGDVIRVTLSYDQTVTVTGSPKITLFAYDNASGASSAVATSTFDLLATYASQSGNSVYFDATTMASAAVGTTDATKPTTSLRYVLNQNTDDVMTILNSGSTPSTVGTIVEPNTGEAVYHFHEYQLSTIKKSTNTFFTVGLAIQQVQWFGTSGQNARFRVTYGGNVNVLNTASLSYLELYKGATTSGVSKNAYLEAAVTGASTLDFYSQSATGSIEAQTVQAYTYVYGDKVWVPFSNYGTNGVTLGGSSAYRDGTDTNILVDAVFDQTDLNGLGGDQSTPYTFPTASSDTINKYTTVTFTKEAPSGGSPTSAMMDIKIAVTLSSSPSATMNDASNIVLKLKAINGAGTSVTAQDLTIDTPTSSSTVYTWLKQNSNTNNAAYGYGLYFEGVESTNDGVRIEQNSAAAVFMLPLGPGTDKETFGSIPGQKLPATQGGLKSNPLLIGINIKEWNIVSGGDNIAQVKVEWYGSVTVVSGSTVVVKSGSSFSGTTCTGGTNYDATLVTTITQPSNIQDFNTAALTQGHVVGLDDSTGIDITNSASTNPITDPTYSLNYPTKTLTTLNHKSSGEGKCSSGTAFTVVYTSPSASPTLSPTSATTSPTKAPTVATSAPTATTGAPTATTGAPTVTTSAPTATTGAPTATTGAPTVTTSAPTTTTGAPTVTTSAPTVTTSAPTVTTGAPTVTPGR
jgi:hypothetical protein